MFRTVEVVLTFGILHMLNLVLLADSQNCIDTGKSHFRKASNGSLNIGDNVELRTRCYTDVLCNTEY